MKRRYYLPGATRYAPFLSYYCPYLIELVEGNHTLIAGSTGAGKSTLEHAIIKSLLTVKFPGADDNGQNARFVFIDPKIVELKMYEDIPHTILYAADIDDIEKALIYTRAVIDDRLRKMQRDGRRKSIEAPIYVFIDEIVDLMTCKRSKEITRILADSISIARAANIFYCISTQAPNRKILKPEIVLNCNCRIALFCNSPIESRQIIGDDTAVNLPLHGLGIVQKNIERYQIKIPLFDDNELLAVCRAWNDQHKLHNKRQHRRRAQILQNIKTPGK